MDIETLAREKARMREALQRITPRALSIAVQHQRDVIQRGLSRDRIGDHALDLSGQLDTGRSDQGIVEHEPDEQLQQQGLADGLAGHDQISPEVVVRIAHSSLFAESGRVVDAASAETAR